MFFTFPLTNLGPATQEQQCKRGMNNTHNSFKKNMRCVVHLSYCQKLGFTKKQKTHKP